MAQYVINI